MKPINCLLVGFLCLGSQLLFARTEINLHREKFINLSNVQDNELSILIPYPGINPGWGNCGVSITAFDAASEFQQLFDATQIMNENPESSLNIIVDTQEPQGSIDIDFSSESGAFRTSILLKTKDDSTFAELSKKIFKLKTAIIYPVQCEQN